MADNAPLRLGLLVSGRGSNMAAIMAAIDRGALAAEIKLVVSDQPQAPALDLASECGLETLALAPKALGGKAAFETRLAEELKNRQVELVVLAGFMRILSPVFLAEFPDRVINIHPSLLPSFPGLSAQRQALDYGVKITGCTVHYVNEIMDGGRIIAQTAVPVEPDDGLETLSRRILKEEHRLLPEAIGRIARNR